MSDTANNTNPADSRSWSLNRVLLLLVSLFFAGLMIDLRGEHLDVVAKHWTAWIPIYYSGVMALLGFVTLTQWKPTPLRIFYWFSTLGIVVGALGFWLHNSGHMMDGIGKGIWIMRVNVLAAFCLLFFCSCSSESKPVKMLARVTFYDLADSHGSQTSTGVRVKEGVTIAVDPKVIPYGSIIIVEELKGVVGDGKFIAEDTGPAVKKSGE